jgi:hypothetical protein
MDVNYNGIRADNTPACAHVHHAGIKACVHDRVMKGVHGMFRKSGFFKPADGTTGRGGNTTGKYWEA